MLLANLPFDVLEVIFCFLDISSVISCSSACKQLYDVKSTSPLVRWKLALAIRGMRAGKNEFISIAERLEKLERYEAAWQTGSWEESYRVELPTPTSHIYAADGYVLAWMVETCRVCVVRLPSPLRGIFFAEYNWDSPVGFENGDIPNSISAILEPQENMVVFTRYDRLTRSLILYPRNMFTGEVLSMASLEQTIILEWEPYSLSLRGKYILIRQINASGENGILVYNWVTLQELINIMIPVTFATFLDNTRILVSFLDTLEPRADPMLRIYDLSVCDAAGQVPKFHDLNLPVRPELKFVNYTFSLGRGCGMPAAYSDDYDQMQYFCDDDWSVLHFTTTGQIEDEAHLPTKHFGFSITLSLSDLLQLVAECDETVIPWRFWGKTTYLALCKRSVYRKEVAGSRMWALGDDADTEFVVRDYHPSRVRRARAMRPATTWSVEGNRDSIVNIPLLRTIEASPDAPATPRPTECVKYTIELPRLMQHTGFTDYNNMLFTADVILKLEREIDQHFNWHTKAIVAYSLI